MIILLCTTEHGGVRDIRRRQVSEWEESVVNQYLYRVGFHWRPAKRVLMPTYLGSEHAPESSWAAGMLPRRTP